MDQKDFDNVKKIQLEILIELDRLCRENNIQYSLYFGTLLGAIRHKGFIPWDDDIDVVMHRKEYDKFMNLISDQIGSDFFIQNYETDPMFFRSFSRIRKNNTLYVQRFFKNLDIHHGIFIDVFPFDAVYENVNKERLRIKYLQALRKLNVIKHFGVDKNSSWIKKTLQKMIATIIPEQRFNRYITKINTKRNDMGLEWLSHLTDQIDESKVSKWKIKESELLALTEVTFEGHQFFAIKTYDKILNRIYGNYMELPPVEERKPHHQIIKIKT